MSAEAPLRAAVIGLGRMGMHHVRACEDSDQVELISVLDHKSDWAAKVSVDYHCAAAASLDSLVEQIDIAVVAVPTADHAETALPLLQAGVSCLVEKPITVTEAEAQTLMSTAQSSNATLCVGHVERFNPAIESLKTALKDSAPVTRLHTRRLNGPSDRTYDVDCVLDLMIHDLDLLNVLGVGDVVSINSTGPTNTDQAGVILKTDQGVEAILEASRKATAHHRDLTLTCGDRVYELDYSARTLTCRNSNTPLTVSDQDPLRAQLAAFVDVVRGGGSDRIATGQDGLDALDLANRVRTTLGLT